MIGARAARRLVLPGAEEVRVFRAIRESVGSWRTYEAEVARACRFVTTGRNEQRNDLSQRAGGEPKIALVAVRANGRHGLDGRHCRALAPDRPAKRRT